ncbi:hypothetical protein HPB50_013282 [Hyalomma asiaticum]|uniref:Uncharacterized protein n=1 Tax=Hyalomma asiaticum TaxID=266040 RepID=A0ACB7T4K6_HYAAI|nr:hypothetical protein HPB50_013282 [Hyalomma asiaticum]
MNVQADPRRLAPTEMVATRAYSIPGFRDGATSTSGLGPVVDDEARCRDVWRPQLGRRAQGLTENQKAPGVVPACVSTQRQQRSEWGPTVGAPHFGWRDNTNKTAHSSTGHASSCAFAKP